MSYCPRPDKTKKTNLSSATTGKKITAAPAPRTEACGPSQSTVITGGGSDTVTTVYVPGLAGPPGPAGPPGKDAGGWGFKYEGEYDIAKQYYAQSDEHPLASVVTYKGSTYVAIQDNKSVSLEGNDFQPDLATDHWSLISKAGAGSLEGEDKGFFDNLKDNLFDWVKNASIGDLLLAGIGAAGVIWAGKKVVDMITDDGKGDGEAETKYSGSPGYVTTNYVAPKVADIVKNLCEVAQDVTTDISQISDEECEFVIGSVTQIRNVLDQLALAYQFEMVDTGGVLKFVGRTTTPVKSLTFADMGFDEQAMGVPPAPMTTKRFQGITLPKRVTLSYRARDTDYNVVTQSADYHTFEEGQVVNLEVPVTLSHQKAKQVTELALMNAHLEAVNMSWTTSYKHIDLEPSDVIEHPSLGLIRVTKITETKEGILEFVGVDAGAPEALLGSNTGVFIPPPSTNIPTVIGYSQAFFIDPPNLNSDDKGVRIYAAVHGYDVDGWPGADIWVSENNGASYELVDSSTRESTVGLVEAITPAHDYHTWDMDTQIVVKLKTNSLLSVSDVDVMNGKNWAMIGQEMIGFANATLIGEKTYRLTRLLRGRQGTEQYISMHSADELFCLLDDSLVKIEWANADRGTVKRYKVVTRGSSLDKVDGFDVQMISNNTMMWTVLNAKVLKVGDDFQFSWSDRARFNNTLRDLSTSGNDEDRAGAGIIIYDTDGTTIKSKHTTGGDTFVYTAAMQIADFGSVQTSIKAAVAQLNKDFGAGYPVLINT